MILALCLFSVVLAASAAPNPTLPTRYHVTGVISLPYADISEPYEAWVDMTSGNSRIDYYGGMAKVVNSRHVSQYGSMYKIIPLPEVSAHCFLIPGMEGAEVTPQPLFPDMSEFKFLTQGPIPNSKDTGDIFGKNYTVGDKSNKYYFFVDTVTKSPSLFYFKGYDDLMGSHYDEYVVTYTSMSSNFDDSVFEVYHGMNCTGFPGPGLAHPMHGNPAFELLGSPKHSQEDTTSQLHQDFASFKDTHQKSYKEGKEETQRLNNFRNNVRHIASHNRKGTSFTLAVNQLADLSDEERGVMLGYRFNAAGRDEVPVFEASHQAIPDHADWRLRGAVTRVKDQGICGSCWSFGSAETLEGSYFIKHGHLVEFSQQALMDCSWKYGNNACDGGEDFRSYQWIMENGCLPTAESYGQYLMQDGSCHASTAKCGVSISNFTLIKPGDETALLEAIYSKGPISVAIDASHKSFGFYSSGVYYEPECGNKPDDLDHAVLAVGYGQFSEDPSDQFWIVKNSWSTYWGNNGYVLMSRKDNNCGVATAASFAEVK